MGKTASGQDNILLHGVGKMDQKEMVEYFKECIAKHYPGGFKDVAVPPPSFTSMNAEFMRIDPEVLVVEVKFPVAYESLNPFGNMQGGMIAAAVDNTIGSLSMIAGPVNFTRDLSLKYRNPVKGTYEFITVKAELTEQKDRRLFFAAEVRDPEGTLLVNAKAMNWIVG